MYVPSSQQHMNTPLPFFNWSLSKALDTETTSFGKGRIRIIFTVLSFSLLKSGIVIVLGSAADQWLQVARAAFIFIVYLSLLKIMLYRPQRLKPLMHVLIILGILIVWSNIFVFTHKINLLTVQFVFSIVVCSFYTMGSTMGVVYSAICAIPVMIVLMLKQNAGILFVPGPTQEFASPGYEIVAALNFISISFIHYQFYNAFRSTIDEKEKLNQQLIQSVNEANKLAQTKTNFLSTMSHELRTPLNSVIGITEMLLEEKNDTHGKENLKLLQFSAQDLLSLINNVLDINKLDSHKMMLEKVPFHLSGFMQNICASLRLKAKTKQIAFVLDIDKQLEGINVLSDPTRLSQVLYNLGNNAIKFTHQGVVTIKLSCTSRTNNTATINFLVSDTGIGIPADKHATIFEQFTQAATETTRVYGGSGLGLAIVKEVLTLFNSDIQLESTPGKGSKFSFTIQFATTPGLLGQVATNDSNDSLNHLKVLVADDNDINRIVIKKQLLKLGITATVADGGKQAVEECKAQQFDAILIDLNMPFVSGYDALKMIRSLPAAPGSATSIIAFTASITEQEKIQAAGFDDYIYKPVKLTDLQDKLARVVLKKQEKQVIQ
jgi:signal transduction histidine kinase/ActR/RegA family two-component response regulator